MENTDKKIRRLRGTVVSDKMSKTVVVDVTRLTINSKYKKYYKLSNRFKAHDENGEYKVGDKVLIEETKPMSKEKRWKVIEKIGTAGKSVSEEVAELMEEEAEETPEAVESENEEEKDSK